MPLVRDLHGCFSSAARRDQRQLRRCELVHRAPDALDADLGDDALNNVIGDAVAVAVGVVFGAKLELLPYEGGEASKPNRSKPFSRKLPEFANNSVRDYLLAPLSRCHSGFHSATFSRMAACSGDLSKLLRPQVMSRSA